ncbi:MAG: IgGFc-binding protein, partial [Polyangiales bacterium]
VTVKLSSSGAITAGGGIAAAPGGGTSTFSIDEGEVVMIVGTTSSDLSGSLIKATEPVQVIAGISCTQMPHGVEACDHVEESLLPIETLGRHYFVTVATAPTGTASKAVVKLYGNVDGTALTYPGTRPSGAPGTINAGQVVDIGVISGDFEIVGDHELTVATFLHGAGPVSGSAKGDPSQSFATTVEQYRKKYVFLAPIDYDANYVDIVQPMDATLTLDGVAVTAKPKLVSSDFGVTRVRLGIGKGGAHVLEGSKPFGIQVMGYGSYTSYQYPGGLNLGVISPVPIK